MADALENGNRGWGPVLFYSPSCVEHIQLASKPFVP